MLSLGPHLDQTLLGAMTHLVDLELNKCNSYGEQLALPRTVRFVTVNRPNCLRLASPKHRLQRLTIKLRHIDLNDWRVNAGEVNDELSIWQNLREFKFHGYTTDATDRNSNMSYSVQGSISLIKFCDCVVALSRIGSVGTLKRIEFVPAGYCWRVNPTDPHQAHQAMPLMKMFSALPLYENLDTLSIPLELSSMCLRHIGVHSGLNIEIPLSKHDINNEFAHTPITILLCLQAWMDLLPRYLETRTISPAPCNETSCMSRLRHWSKVGLDIKRELYTGLKAMGLARVQKRVLRVPNLEEGISIDSTTCGNIKCSLDIVRRWVEFTMWKAAQGKSPAVARKTFLDEFNGENLLGGLFGVQLG